MHRTLPIACILLACSSLAFGAPTESAPSPRALVESWKAGASAFARKVHSYRLQGRETILKSCITIYGNSGVGHTWAWRTVKQNGQYHSVKDDHPPYSMAVSNDGLHWYYGHDTAQRPPHYVIGKDREIAATYLQEQTHPLTPEAFMNSPGMYPSRVPLQDQFLAQPQEIHLIGTETIGGRYCYHLRFGAKLDPRTPADVWLTRQGRYFVPWQTQTSGGNEPVHGMMVVQAGTTFDGIWYPTACNYRIDEGDARHPWKTFNETAKTFPITDINKATGSKTYPVTHAR